MKKSPITLDFETEPIRGRPHYPPKPVSFSLKLAEWRVPRFFAWGHKTGGNNCDFRTAREMLKTAWKEIRPTTPMLCFNGKFDLDVAETHMGLAMPAWDRWEDAMFLLFLEDPHQRLLGLKPAAARLLNMPQDERDAVNEWVLANKAKLEAEFPEIRRDHGGIKPSTAGAFIAYAPGGVVKPYCDGDVVRTLKLWRLLHPRIVDRGMLEAYQRELKLMPILLANERKGVRVDVAGLERDLGVYEAAQAKADAWLRKALKAPMLDFDKDRQVADALEKAGAVKEWTVTAGGANSVSKRNLRLDHFRDRKVASAYSYRQKCATVLETFIRPWLRYTHNGWMHTNWNQVRQAKGGSGDTGGTRTGRPSTDSPNFLNMPKKVRFSDDGKFWFAMPTHIGDLPEPPRVRGYILPDAEDHWVGRRDFAQQELRVLAHFEDGKLMQAYLADPTLDVHNYLMECIIRDLGLDVDRYVTKTLNFGYIYGQGMGSLAEEMGRSVQEVQIFRNAQMQALPGLKDLSRALKDLAAQGRPLRTWGGREYYCEEPKFVEKFGRHMTFEYKMLNYLVQGSSADITKESIIRYHDIRKDGRFMLSVYDENDISAPKKALKAEMLRLREAMMSIELDVPLLSDGEWGPNMGTLEDLVEARPDLSRWGIKWKRS